MIEVRVLLDRYSKVLAFGGAVLWLAVLLAEPQWILHPFGALCMTLGITALRAGQIPLSKYSYLTQIGVPVLAGAVTLGAGSVVFGLGIGVFAADFGLLRKPAWVGLINAGREVIAFVAAFGAYAVVLRFTTTSSPSFSRLNR